MNDTPEHIRARYRRMLLDRPGVERLEMGGRMFDAARRLARASLGDPHGTDASREMRARLFLRLYAADLPPALAARIAASLRGDVESARGVHGLESGVELAGNRARRMQPVIYTVGHSTRSSEELLDVLRGAGVRALADVRRYPASRRHPQHNRAALERSLPTAGIVYEWFGEGLGGRVPQRVPTAESRNNGWEVAAFRYYADAMPTDEFQAALAQLESRARERPTAMLCAERLWWQCHRRLIADALAVRGWSVVHLLEPGKSQEHRLTEFARVEDGVLVYPALV